MTGNGGARTPERVRAGKVDAAGWGVNLLAAVGVLALFAACGRPTRPVPPAPIEGAWPTLLGNAQRSGFADEVAPEQAPEAVWRVGVGRGLYAPLLVEGPVVLAATANRLVAAISAETGEHYWEKRLDGPLSGGLVRREERLFTAAEERSGDAYALSLRRGKEQWDRRIGSSPYPPLLLEEAVVYATEGGNVFALDPDDGVRLWRTRLSGGAAATPVSHGAGIAVATRTDSLYLLDASGGAVLGRTGLPASVSAAPALSGDTLYLPLHSGDVVAVRLPALETLWQASFGAPILAAPVVAPDGALYVLNRNAELWTVAPGARAGRRLIALGGAARASLTLARDRILVGRLDGALFLLRPDGSHVWRHDFDNSIVAPVSVRAGTVYVPLLRGEVVKLR